MRVRSEPSPHATELELAQARARANLLLALYVHADHDLQGATAELALARNDVKRLNAELGALRRSTSWRVTAPLRRLARLCGRGA